MRTLFVSAAAATRLEGARAALRALPADARVTVVGASFDATAELLRSLRRPVFGWKKTTLLQLAAELARPALLSRGVTLATPLSLEALWVRVVHTLAAQGQLGRFEPLAGRPGLARALARTVDDVRRAGGALDGLEPPLQAAARAFDEALAAAGLVDRAGLYSLATQAVGARPTALVLVDVVPSPGVETVFLTALVAAVPSVCAVAPVADDGVTRLSEALGVTPNVLSTKVERPLHALQTNLFTEAGAALEATDFFSAPGEGRECLELARRVLDVSRRGVPFDRIAVALRAPVAYRAPLAQALRRAGVPAYFERGLTAPDPSGRALLALLRCAEEGLSAKRFSEFLSLGQVPREAGPLDAEVVRAEGDASLLPPSDALPTLPAPEPVDDESPISAGRVRSPRRWEKLINEAAVIGGAARWRRRLQGLARAREVEASDPGLSEGQQAHVQRVLEELRALSDFALPLIETLEGWPKEARWGDWLTLLSALSVRTLKFPGRVQALLQELAPMAEVGPVSLREVRTVLSRRLREVPQETAPRRAGQVFVAPPEALRGRSFEVVFVPGLAERVFPQKVREDPLLPDVARQALSLPLETNAHRVQAERLQLQLAVGAAEQGVVLSWPRLDAEHARPRVPSFYMLEALKAVEGSLPSFEDLQRRAEAAGQARLAWPAPEEPTRAVDDTEFDLSVLHRLFQGATAATGQARYLFSTNAALARALQARHARWASSTLTPWDGLVAPKALARAGLTAHQLGKRPFSPTALEQYAACPYRFFLSAIHRLAPLEVPEEIEELGPLEKGSMAHLVQYRLLSRLRAEGVRVTRANLDDIFVRLDAVITEVADTFRDDFAPAIERVWHDGVQTLTADLREWLRRTADDLHWEPWRFELSFGLTNRDERDPASRPEPVQVAPGILLRGSIDLVEKASSGNLRATDYKTGKARAHAGNVVGGGRHLQPVIYALVLEQLFPDAKVESGRLYYCTQVGGYTQVPTELDARSREAFAAVVRSVRSSLEEGFFPAAPDAGECRFCDFRAVCGPDEERRLSRTRKSQRPELDALKQVRKLS